MFSFASHSVLIQRCDEVRLGVAPVLEFGLTITLFGVICVFSALAVVAVACETLKRIFKEEKPGLAPPRARARAWRRFSYKAQLKRFYAVSYQKLYPFSKINLYKILRQNPGNISYIYFLNGRRKHDFIDMR